MEKFVVSSVFSHLIFLSSDSKRATTLDQKLLAQRIGPIEPKPQLRPALISTCWSTGLAQSIGITTWGWDSRIEV